MSALRRCRGCSQMRDDVATYPAYMGLCGECQAPLRAEFKQRRRVAEAKKKRAARARARLAKPAKATQVIELRLLAPLERKHFDAWEATQPEPIRIELRDGLPLWPHIEPLPEFGILHASVGREVDWHPELRMVA